MPSPAQRDPNRCLRVDVRPFVVHTIRQPSTLQRFSARSEASAVFFTSASGIGWPGEKVMPVFDALSPAAAISSACALIASGER
jgi:hypothetical protein